MTDSHSEILLSGPDDQREAAMRFRLTYDGELRPTQRDPEGTQPNPLAAHKHAIRKCFHSQLKQLWQTNDFLKTKTVDRRLWDIPKPDPDNRVQLAFQTDQMEPLADVVADAYREFGYRFVPLVREQWNLLCTLKILFLRRDPPGSVIKAGDIDNRIKTVIDALRRPRNATELVGFEKPGEGEDPFYVLMEDDSQVSHLEVETDTLLDPIGPGNADHRRAKLIVTVELRPYFVTLFNLSFS